MELLQEGHSQPPKYTNTGGKENGVRIGAKLIQLFCCMNAQFTTFKLKQILKG